MPENKKPTYVTYKGTKIEPLRDDNTYSWLDDAQNLLIIEDKWKFVDAITAKKTAQDLGLSNEELVRNRAVTRAILSLLITHDTWQQYKGYELPHLIWEQIELKASQLQAEKEALCLQQLESISFDKNKGMDDYINRISRKVAEIRGVNGVISDVTISGHLIRGLPGAYEPYEPLLNTYRADVNKVKLELLKAEAMIKEKLLRAKPSNQPVDNTPKALAAQGGGNRSNNQSNNQNRSNRRGGHNQGNQQPKNPDAYCTFHKFNGHDIKDCTAFKLAQEYFKSNGKDPNSTNQEASETPVYKKNYIIIAKR